MNSTSKIHNFFHTQVPQFNTIKTLYLNLETYNLIMIFSLGSYILTTTQAKYNYDAGITAAAGTRTFPSLSIEKIHFL